METWRCKISLGSVFAKVHEFEQQSRSDSAGAVLPDFPDSLPRAATITVSGGTAPTGARHEAIDVVKATWTRLQTQTWETTDRTAEERVHKDSTFFINKHPPRATFMKLPIRHRTKYEMWFDAELYWNASINRSRAESVDAHKRAQQTAEATAKRKIDLLTAATEWKAAASVSAESARAMSLIATAARDAAAAAVRRARDVYAVAGDNMETIRSYVDIAERTSAAAASGATLASAAAERAAEEESKAVAAVRQDPPDVTAAKAAALAAASEEQRAAVAATQAQRDREAAGDAARAAARAAEAGAAPHAAEAGVKVSARRGSVESRHLDQVRLHCIRAASATDHINGWSKRVSEAKTSLSRVLRSLDNDSSSDGLDRQVELTEVLTDTARRLKEIQALVALSTQATRDAEALASQPNAEPESIAVLAGRTKEAEQRAEEIAKEVLALIDQVLTVPDRRVREGKSLIEGRLSDHGLHVRARIIGDGNCQFRAVADLLCNDQNRHAEFRSAAVQWLRENADVEMQPGDPITKLREFVHDQSWADYLTRMAVACEWGDELTLRALANRYHVVFRVLSDVAAERGSPIRDIEPIGGSQDRPVHWLAHYAEVHYDSLERLP